MEIKIEKLEDEEAALLQLLEDNCTVALIPAQAVALEARQN
jgi:hypothetical protein